MTAGGLLMAAITGALGWVVIRAAIGRLDRFERRVALGATGLLWTLTAIVLVRRFAYGLGAVSGMSDKFPWGIWIGLDVMSGVALAAGGFVIAATVHVFRLHRFEPVVRPTILTAFLGYQLVAFALMLDIGRPYRIWHPLVMWQHHSIMFEVAWCVTLYSSVLALEFSPVVFEALGWTRANRIVHAVSIPLVIAGVILSTMHQSSLGSLFLILPGKLSPLWYSPLLPVHFLVSAVAVGLAMVILESTFSARAGGRHLESDLLADLGRAMALVLMVYLTLKLGDLAARGAWLIAASQPWQALSLAVELGAGAVVPTLLLARSRQAADPDRLFAAAALAVGGVVLNRVNVSWFGLLPYTGGVYLPSWQEVAVTLSFGTAGIAIFAVATARLPIFVSAPAPVTAVPSAAAPAA